MKITALNYGDAQALTDSHIGIAQQIVTMIEDLGQDQDIVMSLDDPENPEDTEFCVYFPGSSLFLHYTYDGILIEEMADEDTELDEILKVFHLSRTNEAVHWLLTQAN